MPRQSWVALYAVVSLAMAACTTVNTIPGIDGGRDSGADAFVPEVDAGWDAGPPPCEPGEIDCGGTCTRVSGDALNCGSCGVVCPAGVGCAAGRCNCEAPRISCDGVCLDPSEDPFNCGTCGNLCEPTEMCSAGECIVACTAPDVICVNRDEAGVGRQVCADLQTDPINCGRCNTRCAGGAVCLEGRCQCDAGQINCGGRCVDTTSDPVNCGSCGISCGPGGTCEASRCTACGTDHLDCGGRCIDVTSDRFNCGSCGRACGSGETCSGGLCSCSGSLVDCGTGCTDLTTNAMHCGACGIDCGPGGVCSAGTCTCTGTLSLCASGCEDLDTDPSNCGACGMACAVAGSVCVSRVCQCPAGMTDCSGTCRNLSSDPAHCGACGAACPAMQVCVASACTDVPPPPNDTCAGAIALSGASGTRSSDTMLGASQQSGGDCGGAEVYYSITITQRSVLYLDTFGTSFDTLIAHRGTSCAGAASTCADESCATSQSQIAVLADAGTHFFSVHAATSATPGPFSLRWQAVPAAGGSNTQITAAGPLTGSTAGATHARTASCGFSATSPENGYWFTLCPGVTRTVGASTCSGASWDTVLHAIGPTGAAACNDDSCGLQSTISFSAAGPGLWEIFMDGYGSGNSGSYTLSVTGL